MSHSLRILQGFKGLLLQQRELLSFPCLFSLVQTKIKYIKKKFKKKIIYPFYFLSVLCRTMTMRRRNCWRPKVGAFKCWIFLLALLKEPCKCFCSRGIDLGIWAKSLTVCFCFARQTVCATKLFFLELNGAPTGNVPQISSSHRTLDLSRRCQFSGKAAGCATMLLEHDLMPYDYPGWSSLFSIFKHIIEGAH